MQRTPTFLLLAELLTVFIAPQLSNSVKVQLLGSSAQSVRFLSSAALTYSIESLFFIKFFVHFYKQNLGFLFFPKIKQFLRAKNKFLAVPIVSNITFRAPLFFNRYTLGKCNLVYLTFRSFFLKKTFVSHASPTNASLMLSPKIAFGRNKVSAHTALFSTQVPIKTLFSRISLAVPYFNTHAR